MGPQGLEDKAGMAGLQRAGQEGAQVSELAPLEAHPLLPQRDLRSHHQEKNETRK